MIYNHPISKDYKWYISGIYCQLGDYMVPIPPIKGLLREPGNSIDRVSEIRVFPSTLSHDQKKTKKGRMRIPWKYGLFNRDPLFHGDYTLED